MPRWTRGLVAAAGLVGLAGAALAAPELAHAEPTTYALDGGRLEVLIRYDRSTIGGGHDHVLQSTGFSGTVVWDPDDVSACEVAITLPVQTLQVDPPGARARRGLEGSTSDKNKESIKENALSKGQLNAAAHPNITYQATKCRPAGSSVTVTGNLTIRGTTAPVETTMQVSADGSSFAAKGSFTSTHSTFGFKPYSALLGALRNDEKLTFFVDVKGSAK